MTTLLNTPSSPFGQTLAEYAATRDSHPQKERNAYRALMRFPDPGLLPPVTRHQREGDTIKFCLPVEDSGADALIGGGQPTTTELTSASAPLSLLPATPTLETESVIIPMKSYRGPTWHTLCISSQVGCRMGCTFCETGRMGLIKNLTAAQIVRQRIVARTFMKDRLGPPGRGQSSSYFGDGIQNIVFMGMGEPLDNFDNVTQAIRVLNEPNGLDFPLAQITVSTVGRIDGIRKLAALNWPTLRLAVSLNAATDDLRNTLMPINRGMPLKNLQRALLDYPLGKKGRFLIEYVLIHNVNDSLADADAVVQWCKPLRCVVNLIPYNPQRGATYQTPPDDRILAFLYRIKEQGIFVKRRVTQGRDLMGACGQLGNPDVRRKKANAEYGMRNAE